MVCLQGDGLIKVVIRHVHRGIVGVHRDVIQWVVGVRHRSQRQANSREAEDQKTSKLIWQLSYAESNTSRMFASLAWLLIELAATQE